MQRTLRVNTIAKINVHHLKFRPIIDQMDAKVIANCLKPLAKNEFTISDTLNFLDLIKKSTNSDESEDVSYNVETYERRPLEVF